MSANSTKRNSVGQVLFVCPHGAAKSVLAVAIAERLAKISDLRLSFDSAGTEPDDVINPIASGALERKGLHYDRLPRRVQSSDLDEADLVISFGIPVEDLPSRPKQFVDWADVPDASDDVELLCDTLESRISDLLVSLHPKT